MNASSQESEVPGAGRESQSQEDQVATIVTQKTKAHVESQENILGAPPAGPAVGMEDTVNAVERTTLKAQLLQDDPLVAPPAGESPIVAKQRSLYDDQSKEMLLKQDEELFEHSNNGEEKALRTLQPPKEEARPLSIAPKIGSPMGKLTWGALAGEVGKMADGKVKATADILARKIKYSMKSKGTIQRKFVEYASLFENMTEQMQLDTAGNEVIEILLSTGSKYIIALTRKNVKVSELMIWDTGSLRRVQTFQLEGIFIRAQEVVENADGSEFAVAYNNDGAMRLFIFTPEKVIIDVNVNKACNVDICSLPLPNFPSPIASCCFTKPGQIFHSFIHRNTQTQYHYIYDYVNMKAAQPIQTYPMTNKSEKNFPWKSYYAPRDNLIHTFFRQGDALVVNASDTAQIKYQEISKYDLGRMFMYGEKVMVVRCSHEILFFTYKAIDRRKGPQWVLYHRTDSVGFITGSKRKPEFQVIEDSFIYYYSLDTETYMPTLNNVMINFLKCSTLIVGEKETFCLAYKQKQPDCVVFRRKQIHDFMVTANVNDFENAIGLTDDDLDFFIVAKDGFLIMFNDESYAEIYRIDLQLPKSDTREPVEVVSMISSEDGQFIAVSVGKQFITGVEEIMEIVVLKKQPDSSEFKIIQRIDMRKDGLSDVCKRFTFDIKNSENLIFVNSSVVIKYNTIHKKRAEIYDFSNFEDQPEYFIFNEEQNVCIVTTESDTLMINFAGADYDLDTLFGISDIKDVIFFEDYFYILANKRNKKIGYFLLKVHETETMAQAHAQNMEDMFIINKNNKLDIDACNMSLFRDKSYDAPVLVVSYKSIYVNTYTINIINLNNGLLVFKMETFCLWETGIMSFLNDTTNDYITLTSTGMKITGLSCDFLSKNVRDNENRKLKLHSLASCKYLMLDKSNHILFSCMRDDKIIQIEGQYKSAVGETHFENIYKVNLSSMKIRELVLIQSFYYSETLEDIARIIGMQESFDMFFQSFLELDRRNLVSIFAFESGIIKRLLCEKNRSCFNESFPIFYRNKHSPEDTSGTMLNALDVALESNQIKAVNLIINHITEFQNNYVSSYLFDKNLFTLMEKGIDVIALLASNVFRYHFEMQEWPSVHPNNAETLKPYNGTLFDLRKSYALVFPELQDERKDERAAAKENQVVGESEPGEGDHSGEAEKFYKISYSLNLLPGYSLLREKSDDKALQAILEGYDDNERNKIFESEALQELIEYKWETYGFGWHLVGFFFHIFYITVMTVYVDRSFNTGTFGQKGDNTYPYLLGLGLCYQFVYDSVQMFRTGKEYFKEMWNYSDMIFMYVGILNFFLQLETDDVGQPACQVTMMIILLLALIKLMSFLRILRKMAYMVVLLSSVINDLVIFLTFYVILLFMFSLVLGVIGYQNYTRTEWYRQMKAAHEAEGDHRRRLRAFSGGFSSTVGGSSTGTEGHGDGDSGYKGLNGSEYYEIGRTFGNFLVVLRMSMGDNDGFGWIPEMGEEMDVETAAIFWLVWLIICVLTFIIFLNFIIAEAAESYNRVNENVDNILSQGRIVLINETEEMAPHCYLKTDKNFPRFLISRKIEE